MALNLFQTGRRPAFIGTQVSPVDAENRRLAQVRRRPVGIPISERTRDSRPSARRMISFFGRRRAKRDGDRRVSFWVQRAVVAEGTRQRHPPMRERRRDDLHASGLVGEFQHERVAV